APWDRGAQFPGNVISRLQSRLSQRVPCRDGNALQGASGCALTRSETLGSIDRSCLHGKETLRNHNAPRRIWEPGAWPLRTPLRLHLSDRGVRERNHIRNEIRRYAGHCVTPAPVRFVLHSIAIAQRELDPGGNGLLSRSG